MIKTVEIIPALVGNHISAIPLFIPILKLSMAGTQAMVVTEKCPSKTTSLIAMEDKNQKKKLIESTILII
jgi:hypothetical protein